MRILIIKKKFIINIIFTLLIILLGYLIFILTTSKFDNIETIYQLDVNKNTNYDLTGDGIDDTIQLIEGQNKIDFKIKSLSDSYYLSNEIKDKVLLDNSIHWKPNLFIHDISRDKIPELIIQGTKHNKSITYVFHWNGKSFSLIKSLDKNIFGILDSKNSKTPQCFSLASKAGISSEESFMLLSHSAVDTTNESNNIPSLSTILKFINIFELPYVIDETPDIFSRYIDKDQLSLLWNLDKDNYSYAFQNSFFYDYKWNDSNEPTQLKWRLSFEKSSLKGNINKEEITIVLDLKKEDSIYKIMSIQKIK